MTASDCVRLRLGRTRHRLRPCVPLYRGRTQTDAVAGLVLDGFADALTDALAW